MKANTSEGVSLSYDLTAWRRELRNENYLRREVDKASKNGRAGSIRWEAMWSGWYEVKRNRIGIENRVIYEGGLLCLVAP